MKFASLRIVVLAGDYVRRGGVVVLNAVQVKGLPTELLGVRSTGATGESHNARCLSPGEQPQDLRGQIFRYEQVEPKGSEVLVATPSDKSFGDREQSRTRKAHLRCRA